MQNDAQDGREAPPAWSVRTQMLAVGAVALGAGLVALLVFSLQGAPVETPHANPRLVSFVPTSQQLSRLQIQTVGRRIFHTEIVTDGYVAPNGGFVAAGSGHGPILHGLPILTGQSSDTLQAESDLATANAQLRLAAANEKRQHELYQSDGAAQKDWQQAQADLATASASVSSARNRLRLLGKTDAEIDALESQASRTDGAAPVFAVGDLSSVWLVANVREADAALVHLGDEAQIDMPAYPQESFHAAIAYMDSMIDPATHRLVIGAMMRNPGGRLKPNMAATFTILAGQAADAPAVPQSAVVYEGDVSRVWVAGRNGDLTLRRITVGRSSGGYSEVISGLSAGEQIVTSGALFIDQAAGNG